MKFSIFSIILFTTIQLIESNPLRVWSNYGPRQGILGTSGIPGIAPWSGSGRLSGMMAGMAPLPGMGINAPAQSPGISNPLGGTMYQIVPLSNTPTGANNPVQQVQAVNGLGMSQQPSVSLLPSVSQFYGMPQLPSMSQFPGMQQLPGMSQFPGMSQLPGMSQIPGMSQFPGMSQLPQNVPSTKQSDAKRPNLWSWLAYRQQLLEQQQQPVYQIFVPFTNAPTQPKPVVKPVAPTTATPVSSNNATTSNTSNTTGPKLAISCNYNDTKQSVLCSGFGFAVSCDAKTIGLNNSKFTYFAVGAMPINGQTPEDVRFPMYPYNANTSSFLDSTLVDEEYKQDTTMIIPQSSIPTITYSLYFSSVITDSGLKIKEPACWKQMMDTFTAGVKSAFEANIESAFINVNNADGSSDSVVALASVSIA